MKKTIKRILTMLFVFAVTALFAYTIVNSDSTSEDTSINDYARITDVDYKAILVDEPNEGGKVIITEKLTFDVHAASEYNLFWELWRDLPESTVDGLKVEYKVNSVKQVFDDGTSKIYTESPKLYWYDSDYTSSTYGPGKWFHSKGPYNEAAAQYECVLFYVDGLYREKVTFEIEYEMSNAALKYQDVSELYLSMYSGDTIKYLNSFKGEILIPNKDMPKKGNYEAHTYGTNANSFAFEESITKNKGYHTFIIDLDESELKFKSYNEYIEFTLLGFNEDSQKFTDYAPNNMYSHENALAELRAAQKEYDNIGIIYSTIKMTILIVCIIIAIILINKMRNQEDKIREKYNLYKPSMMMQQYFRDIPSDLDPCFAADLAFCKHDKRIKDEDAYAAILLSLVRKKYLELKKIDETKDWDFKNINIVIKYRPTRSTTTQSTNIGIINTSSPAIIPEPVNNNLKLEPLTDTEELYFNLIIRHTTDNEITMNVLQTKIDSDYENTRDFVKHIDNSTINIGIAQGYFQKANYKEIKEKLTNKAMSYQIVGVGIVIFLTIIFMFTRIGLAYGGFLILGTTLFIYGGKIHDLAITSILLTQFGEDEYAKWYGLYNYLNSETLMNEKRVIDLPIWEKYLVYATAFGISEKVIKAIKINCPNVIDSPILSNSYYISSSFRTNIRTISSSTRSTAVGYSYSSSGGGFGGGHYGGGGRGGGGGGGGH